MNQVSCDSRGNCPENRPEPTFDIFLPYSGPKRSRKFCPLGWFFTHIWKYPQYASKSSFRVWHKKKTYQKQKFKILISDDFAQHCCAHSCHISERSDNNWGSLFDLKKKRCPRWTDGRRTVRYWKAPLTMSAAGLKTKSSNHPEEHIVAFVFLNHVLRGQNLSI